MLGRKRYAFLNPEFVDRNENATNGKLMQLQRTSQRRAGPSEADKCTNECRFKIEYLPRREGEYGGVFNV
jgi:hypothetical protein